METNTALMLHKSLLKCVVHFENFIIILEKKDRKRI